MAIHGMISHLRHDQPPKISEEEAPNIVATIRDGCPLTEESGTGDIDPQIHKEFADPRVTTISGPDYAEDLQITLNILDPAGYEIPEDFGGLQRQITV